MHIVVRLTGASKIYQSKTTVKVELKLQQYTSMQADSSLKKKHTIVRQLEKQNLPICFAACSIVFKSPFTVWYSFLSKLSSTNFIIFFQVRSDFNNCSCSFNLFA